MAIVLQQLKDLNWKRHLNTLVKVFSDLKNAGLLILLVFIIYGIGWDTVLRPSLIEIQGKDEAIKKERAMLEEKGNLQKQYDTWQEQLKGLEQDLIKIADGNSAKVLSVSESTELIKMARGENREALGLQPLQPPHDRLEKILLEPTADRQIDLMPLLDPSATAGTQPAPPTGDHLSSPGTPTSAMGLTLPAENFEYDLKVSGTYAALIDLINQLVLHPKLVKINKVAIEKPANAEAEEEPDPKEYPDYPVKLNMVVSLSIFLYGNEQSASAP